LSSKVHVVMDRIIDDTCHRDFVQYQSYRNTDLRKSTTNELKRIQMGNR
jgi:hypothetical protein